MNGTERNWPADLPTRLAARFRQPLPGRVAHARFAPQLSYGRHYGPPTFDARPAAVLALIYPVGREWYLPLTLRPANLADHAGQISLPGGAVERGETGEQAALRELHEELGLVPASIRLLGPLSPLYLFVSNFHVTPWLAATQTRPTLRPNPAEVEEVLEVPLSALADPANHGQHDLGSGRLQFTAPHIRWGRHLIWGATSMILAEVMELLRDIS